MDKLYSIFFGAGVAGFTYSTFVRRIGYSNTKNVFVFTGVVFLIATFFFYTVMAYIFHV
jgi:hypothetical protein